MVINCTVNAFIIMTHVYYINVISDQVITAFSGP